MEVTNILVAGNSARNVELAREAFERIGYQIIPASEMSLSLFLAQKNLPDLIIADRVFKQGDGMTFITELQQDPELDEIPVLFIIDVTENDFNDEAAIASGAIQVLHHPVNHLQLLELAEPLIRHRKETKGIRPEYTPE